MSNSNAIAFFITATQRCLDFIMIVAVYLVVGFFHNLSLEINDYYLIGYGIIAYYLMAAIHGIYRIENISLVFSDNKDLFTTWLSVCFLIILALFVTKTTEYYSRVVIKYL